MPKVPLDSSICHLFLSEKRTGADRRGVEGADTFAALSRHPPLFTLTHSNLTQPPHPTPGTHTHTHPYIHQLHLSFIYSTRSLNCSSWPVNVLYWDNARGLLKRSLTLGVGTRRQWNVCRKVVSLSSNASIIGARFSPQQQKETELNMVATHRLVRGPIPDSAWTGARSI